MPKIRITIEYLADATEDDPDNYRTETTIPLKVLVASKDPKRMLMLGCAGAVKRFWEMVVYMGRTTEV